MRSLHPYWPYRYRYAHTCAFHEIRACHLAMGVLPGLRGVCSASPGSQLDRYTREQQRRLYCLEQADPGSDENARVSRGTGRTRTASSIEFWYNSERRHSGLQYRTPRSEEHTSEL